jgi:hypothetical protein
LHLHPDGTMQTSVVRVEQSCRSTASRLGIAPSDSTTRYFLPVLLLRFDTALINAGGVANLAPGVYSQFFPAQSSYEAVCVQSGTCGTRFRWRISAW